MAWRIELTATAAKQLSRLGAVEARRITRFLRDRLAGADDPRRLGRALTGPLGGLWRYRVGDYRVICEIRDDRLVVLVLRIANRRDAYR